jgi:hypothetical protein
VELGTTLTVPLALEGSALDHCECAGSNPPTGVRPEGRQTYQVDSYRRRSVIADSRRLRHIETRSPSDPFWPGWVIPVSGGL